MRNTFNKQKIGEKIATGILCISALFFFVVFGAISIIGVCHKHHRVDNLSAAEISAIEKNLVDRYADDCTIKRTSKGFSCSEVKTGKVFYIDISGVKTERQ